MDSSAPGGILLFVILIAIDFIVYGFSTSLRAIRKEEREGTTQEEKAGDSRREKRKQILQKVLKDQSDYVDTVENISACVNLVFGAVYAGSLSDWWLARMPGNLTESNGAAAAFWPYGLLRVLIYIASYLIILIVIETLGVQVPKRLASAHPEKWADRSGNFFYGLMLFFLPVTRVISGLTHGILFLFGVRGTSLRGDVTEEEIRSIVNEGHEQGVIEQTEAEMITNIFEFSDKEARDIMTNRSDIIAIDAQTTLQNSIRYMLEQPNSRFPVYHDNIDSIIGIVHIRDAMQYREAHPQEINRPLGEINAILRKAIYVPETKSIDDLFRQMQKEKAQLVVVIDEYGQTSGIVAMEDILEEIVGNIMDEYDVDENHITPTGNKNEFIVDGRTPLEELEKKFGMHFEDDRFETLNGLLMSLMDNVPAPDCHFETEYDGFRIKVLSVANRQVQKALMTKIS